MLAFFVLVLIITPLQSFRTSSKVLRRAGGGWNPSIRRRNTRFPSSSALKVMKFDCDALPKLAEYIYGDQKDLLCKGGDTVGLQDLSFDWSSELLFMGGIILFTYLTGQKTSPSAERETEGSANKCPQCQGKGVFMNNTCDLCAGKGTVDFMSESYLLPTSNSKSSYTSDVSSYRNNNDPTRFNFDDTEIDSSFDDLQDDDDNDGDDIGDSGTHTDNSYDSSSYESSGSSSSFSDSSFDSGSGGSDFDVGGDDF